MNGFLPYQLDREPAPPLLQWIATDGRSFTEPFFESTVARLRMANSQNRLAQRRRTPLDALRDVAPGAPVAGIIFHISRCGSTLFARTLAALPEHIVASEPPIVDALLRIRLRVSEATDEQIIDWLRGAAHSLGQANAAGGRRLYIKVDCWSLFSLPLLRRAFPAARLFFVYRDPLEVLVSLMRIPSYTLVRDVVTLEQLQLTREERDALDLENYAAAVLGAFFREAEKHRALLTPVAYPTLPAWIWTQWPDGNFTAADVERMRAAGAQNAKDPAAVFAPDTQAKRAAATANAQAAIARWTAAPYRRWLESTVPTRHELQSEF